MKKIDKWMPLNGSYIALTSDNVMVGYLLEVKPISKPSELPIRSI